MLKTTTDFQTLFPRVNWGNKTLVVFELSHDFLEYSDHDSPTVFMEAQESIISNCYSQTDFYLLLQGYTTKIDLRRFNDKTKDVFQ